MNNKEIPFDNKYIRDNISKLLTIQTPSKNNIRFCSDDYFEYGYTFDTEMTNDNVNRLIEENQIRTRVSKSKDVQKKRTTEKAEVFTPKWVCEYQVNMCILEDNESTKKELSNKIKEYIFDKEWNEEEYYSFINKTWLEACCGEAPYVVSRYDTVSGEDIEVKDRIGFLDRKLQLISRYKDKYENWFEDVKKAYKKTYAYEWQGDNLFIARCNLLMTFIDYFEKDIDDSKVNDIIKIIIKNTTQMDGLTWMLPGKNEPAYMYNWTCKDNDIHDARYIQYYELANGYKYEKPMEYERDEYGAALAI